ncbi:hypothetical protein [Micromonospora sp. HUAS LYJ1]|uniref:hypothetical protein n=1 Tax=Micromonospora sp. HUAS LYJ1 TaxID=3061626 RepID=UPI002672E239|nr:hypothetical protein [Micromonospora sp. HUAS LYJ1]WKU02983.1 hypothetical protein Q2K16_19015 [Micromonospora sp. HUAS LYJ1]
MSTPTVGRLSFRTVFGGPGIPGEVITELKRLQRELRGREWGYDYDLFVTVGGDLSVVSEPTGLRRPRVHLAARTVSGELRYNSEEVLRAEQPAALLRSGLLDALEKLVARVAARDVEFDAGTERARLASLRDGESV